MNSSPQADCLHVVRYTAAHKDEWNAFLSTSRNGTFLLHRNYMDYHADRFRDASLLFYKGEKLMALLPANLQGDCYYSHGGLTYGSFIIGAEMTIERMLEAFNRLNEYLREHCPEVRRVTYRPIPAIYHKYPSEEELYALYRMNARLTERKLSSTIDLQRPYAFSTLRRRKLHKAEKNGLTVVQDKRLEIFWPVLNANLWERHGEHPVHSLAELQLLGSRFPEEIKLFRIEKDGQMMGGCLLFITDEVAHVQYIASTPEGRELGALDLLFHTLIEKYKNQKHYFDFGVSTEDGGELLNGGLVFQKEGFGGRGICYDTYEYSLTT